MRINKLSLYSILFFFFAALYLSGCGSSGGNGGQDEAIISEATAAEGIAEMANTTHVLISGLISMLDGIGLIASTSNYDSNKGWTLPFSSFGSVGGISAFYIKVYDLEDNEVTEKSEIASIKSDSISKFSIYIAGSFTIDEPTSSDIQKKDISSLFYIGETEKNPLVIDLEKETANGKTIAEFNIESNKITTSLGFLNLNISSDFPNGTVNIIVSVGATEIYNADLEYDGTDTATLEFIDGGTYNIGLESSSGP